MRVKTENNKIFEVNSFCEVEIRECNLVITSLPETLPTSIRNNPAEYIISSYEDPRHVAKALSSLRAAFKNRDDFWDVNVVNKDIPNKE